MASVAGAVGGRGMINLKMWADVSVCSTWWITAGSPGFILRAIESHRQAFNSQVTDPMTFPKLPLPALWTNGHEGLE